jgi:hypothetical protein
MILEAGKSKSVVLVCGKGLFAGADIGRHMRRGPGETAGMISVTDPLW